MRVYENMRDATAIAATLLFLLLAPAELPGAPLAPGRLEYALAWNGIPAGSATVAVQTLDDQPTPAVHIDAIAHTNRFVDLFWRLRANAAATFARNDFTPLRFRYDRYVNRDYSLTEVTFTARPSSVVGTLYRRGRTNTVAVDETGVLDPITAIFQALAQPLAAGRSLTYEVFTGEARYRVELVVTGEETVRVPAGTFRAWRVVPRVWKVGKGLDERLRRATVWVSQGPTHVLLRIRSEVFIGAVTGDLQRMLSAPDPVRAPPPPDS